MARGGYNPLSTDDWNKLMRSNVVARVFPRGMAVPGLGGQEFGGTTPVPPPSPSPTPIPASPTPTPTGTPQPTPTPTPSATPPVVFETEYQDILDYATLQGYTLPSYSVQLLQNQLVIDLKTNGNWNEMDVMYVPAGDGDEDFARINWIDPDGSFNLIIGGGITYAGGDSGFAGNGTNGYLDTNFVPNARARGNTSDVSMGGWFGALNNCMVGSYLGFRQHLLSQGTSSNFYASYVEPTLSPNAGSISITGGMWAVDNDGIQRTRLYKNESLLSQSLVDMPTASLSDARLSFLARHRGFDTYDFYSNSGMAFGFHGTRNAKIGLTSILNSYLLPL